MKSIYYVTDANPSWPAERQDKWLERFNYPSLTITSAPEAMPSRLGLPPGAWRKAASKLRLEVPAMPTEAMTRQLEGKPVIGL